MDQSNSLWKGRRWRCLWTRTWHLPGVLPVPWNRWVKLHANWFWWNYAQRWKQMHLSDQQLHIRDHRMCSFALERKSWLQLASLLGKGYNQSAIVILKDLSNFGTGQIGMLNGDVVGITTRASFKSLVVTPIPENPSRNKVLLNLTIDILQDWEFNLCCDLTTHRMRFYISF